MDENGCLHDGSILQNEDESVLKVILIFITLYTHKNGFHHMQFKKFIYKLYLSTKLYLHNMRGGFLYNFIMSICERVFKVLKISFIIVRRQGSLYDVCGVDELFHTSQGVEFCFCRLFFFETISIMGMKDMLGHVRSFNPFGRFLFIVVGQEQAIHLTSETDKFKGRHAMRFVLKLADHLSISVALQEMAAGVFRRVVAVQVFLHVFIKIVRFNMVAEAVGVSEKQLRPIAVLLYKHVIMKVIHYKFTQI